MTIASQTSRINYTGNGATVAFAVPFYFLLNADIVVYLTSTTGAQVLQLLGTHYSLVGAGVPAGGTCTFAIAPPSGYIVTVLRDPAVTQSTSYNNNDPFPAASHEKALDKLTMISQRSRDRLNRTVILPDHSSYTGLSLPDPDAGKYLKWKQDLTGLENSEATTTAPGNYAIATQSEAEGATLNNVLMTPLRTAQEIAVLVDAALETNSPEVRAWEHGVPGDGTNQTVALQAIITASVDSTRIVLRGHVSVTALDFTGKTNIVLCSGDGSGNSAGSGSNTYLYCTAGAIGAHNPAFKLWTTFGCGFEDLYISFTNPLFDGNGISYGAYSSPTNSAYMKIKNCVISNSGVASSAGLQLNGTTNGIFENINFGGTGGHIELWWTAGVGFCSNHTFTECTFHPGTVTPIRGSGLGITWLSCCFEAGSDGKANAYLSNTSHQNISMNFIGCTFFDVTVAGGIWLSNYWGNGFSVMGCYFSNIVGGQDMALAGFGGGDPQESGVRGFNITGNFFNGGTHIVFNGTIVAKTNCRGGIIGGNAVTLGTFLSGETTCEQTILLPNSMYADPLGTGANLQYIGIPQYATRTLAIAAGLNQPGMMYRCSTASPADNFPLCVI